MVLEKTLESPLDCKEIQPIHPIGISPEYSLEKLMLKLKPPVEKNCPIRKEPNSWKDSRWEEKGMTEDEMFGCYHQLNGHEFE